MSQQCSAGEPAGSGRDGVPDGAADDTDGSDEMATDGAGELRTHTVRLELVDEPGELLAALEPIAENGGNLLSIFHERGNLTPRGHIPVEVDFECPPDRFDPIVDALREEGVTVIQAGEEVYGETLSLLLTGHLIDTDLSDTLRRLEECTAASVEDLSLTAPEGTDDVSSARLRLATRSGQREAALESVRKLAAEKDLDVVEPLTEGSQ